MKLKWMTLYTFWQTSKRVLLIWCDDEVFVCGRNRKSVVDFDVLLLYILTATTEWGNVAHLLKTNTYEYRRILALKLPNAFVYSLCNGVQ